MVSPSATVAAAGALPGGFCRPPLGWDGCRHGGLVQRGKWRMTAAGRDSPPGWCRPHEPRAVGYWLAAKAPPRAAAGMGWRRFWRWRRWSHRHRRAGPAASSPGRRSQPEGPPHTLPFPLGARPRRQTARTPLLFTPLWPCPLGGLSCGLRGGEGLRPSAAPRPGPPPRCLVRLTPDPFTCPVVPPVPHLGEDHSMAHCKRTTFKGRLHGGPMVTSSLIPLDLKTHFNPLLCSTGGEFLSALTRPPRAPPRCAQSRRPLLQRAARA